MPEHLRFEREVPITERHRRQDRRPRFHPDDLRLFGRDLAAQSLRPLRQVLTRLWAATTNGYC